MKSVRGVYQENGYVKIRIWLGSKYENGLEKKPYRRSMGAWNNMNIQRAKNHIDEVRANFKNGIVPGPELKALPFPEACDIYFKLHWTQKDGRTKKGIRNIGYFMERFRKTWTARALHSILPSDIDKYVATRKEEGVKVSTVNRELAILSSMFSKIDEWVNRREIGPYLLPTSVQGASYNPATYVERASTVQFKRKRVATDDELRKVREYCDANDPEFLEIITRTILTGLRKNNAETANGKAQVGGIVSKSKGRKVFAFPLDFSRELNYKNFVRRWNRVRKECDMLDFTWHDWRHTSGTILSRLGFTDEEIQPFYNHSSLEQTRDYINRQEERVQPHVDALKGYLENIFRKNVVSIIGPSVSNSVSNGDRQKAQV